MPLTLKSAERPIYTFMLNRPPHLATSLSDPFVIDEAQVNFFRANGFIKLKHVLHTDIIDYFNETISFEVSRLNTQQLPLEKRDTYGKAFLQIMNIWTQSEPVKELVFSRKLAKMATDLLEVDGVRLYHDQALYKEPGGGITPWHADQYYWPLNNDRTVTLWIPLQDTPLEMGPLEFSANSDQLTAGRDKEIGDESQVILERTLAEKGYQHIIAPFDCGDVTFHRGWLFHRAGANRTNQMRGVMTIIYMDKNMALKHPENKNQLVDWETWCPGAEIGKVIDSPINPVLFQYE